jgi:hypothetical protein
MSVSVVPEVKLKLLLRGFLLLKKRKRNHGNQKTIYF